MLPLLLAVVAIVAASCAMMIVPTIALSRLGYAKTSLAVAIATTSAVLLDYLFNWDSVRYPHWLFGAPTWLFPLTFLVGLGAIGVAFKSILDRI